MTPTRAAPWPFVWHALAAGALLAAVGPAPSGGARGDDPLHACDAAGCALAPPTAEELGAITAEADRLIAEYADDPAPLARQCAALGASMRERAADVRMLAYMWRAPDPAGHLAAVTGDAHRTEPAPGAGTVHIARGYDALNPDRGLPAIVRTARHEFAHLAGARQGDAWLDAADQLAAACGPP